MNKEVISTPLGPSALGPYSQAIRAGNLLFVSGQIPLDPSTGQIIPDKTIQAQTRRALQNLLAIVGAAGGSVENIVKTTVFLRDMGDFAAMNAEEHTSELQSLTNLVCRLLLEKKNEESKEDFITRRQSQKTAFYT